ncbi:hypothetical protein KJ840_05325 [Patescibacteria group bacterium]|nr:hypothetical protein [Patescibacteria group bacterium]
MTSIYRQILKKAWQITKKLIYLWPLGFFVAFLGNGGEYQVLFKEFSLVSKQPERVNIWKENFQILWPGWDLGGLKALFLFFIIIIALVLICFFVWLIVSSLGGLIKGAALGNNNEKSTFKKLLLTGSKNFWPLLGLNIIAKVIVYGFLIFVLGPLMLVTFKQGHGSLNLVVVGASFLIFVPLTIIVSLVTKYAAAFVMLDGQKMTECFKNAWRLFSANWLVSLEMAFILFVINIVIGLCYILASLLIFSPFLSLAVMNALNKPGLFDILMYSSVTVLLILSALIGAWLATFQISSWTLLYLRLTEGGKAYSKIVRWTAALPEKFKRKNV